MAYRFNPRESRHTLIFFDGDCALCNGLALWLYRHDQRRCFRFGTLNSATAKRMLTPDVLRHGRSTIVVVEGQSAYTRSRAVVHILWRLGKGWGILGWLLYIIPWWFRDAAYRIIARYRYRWFGKTQLCFVPDDTHRSLMLE